MTRIELLVQEIIHDSCPIEFMLYGPSLHSLELDVNTVVKDKYGDTIGCRGITCKECWNQEVKYDTN